jgi:MFS family permease
LYTTLKDVKFKPAQTLPRRSNEPAAAKRRWLSSVPANVAYLGLTSMFTDVSSEMVNSVLPLYLTFQLGLGHFQLGLFNGTYQALAAFTALGGAVMADRHRRYKAVAGLGYGVSAATRIGLTLARHSWAPATAMLYADRAAKGVRTAPRDALISLSARPGRVGEAFGVHRALDTLGALAGPLVAFGLLTLRPGSYGTIFTTSFWIALIGLVVLGLFVTDRVRDGVTPERLASFRSALGLLRLPAFRRLVIAGVLLSCVTIGDALVYLTFQQRTSMSVTYFPLLYAGTAISYVLLAVPCGRLADRARPAAVFIGGQLFLLVVDATLLRRDPGPVSLLAMLAALGLYYAATDGVLAMLATTLLPESSRASGLGLLGVVMALGQVVASSVFGLLWSWRGVTTAVGFLAAGLVAAIVVSAVLLRPLLRPSGGQPARAQLSVTTRMP